MNDTNSIMLRNHDSSVYWYTGKKELIDTNFHYLEILRIYEKLGMGFQEIKDWALNENSLDESLKKLILNNDLENACKQIKSEYIAEGLKLIALKHANISIRKVYINRTGSFILVINYYGKKGFETLKHFVIDYPEILKNIKIATYDAELDTFYKFQNIEDLMGTF